MVEEKLGGIQKSPEDVFVNFEVTFISGDEVPKVHLFLVGWFPGQDPYEQGFDDLFGLCVRLQEGFDNTW